MLKSKKSKKGFTLAELSLVIVLISIVGTMAVTFISQFNSDAYLLSKNRNAMNDINTIRSVIEEWVKYYDNGSYTITPASSVLQATKSGTTDKIKIENKKLVWTKNGAEYKTYPLESVNELSFDFAKYNNATIKDANNKDVKNVIQCTARFNQGNNFMVLYFSLLTQTPRSRYSPTGN